MIKYIEGYAVFISILLIVWSLISVSILGLSSPKPTVLGLFGALAVLVFIFVAIVSRDKNKKETY